MSEPEEKLSQQRDSSKKKKKKTDKRSEKKKKKKPRERREEEEEEEEQPVEEEEEKEHSECVVLRGIFRLGKKSHDVLLTRTRLSWTPITPETPTGEPCVTQPGVLLLQDVYAVKVKRRRAAGQESGGAVLGVALFCCKRTGRKLEVDTLHLNNASTEHTQTWYNTLRELLTGFSRPRYLKVFINPSSHKKESVHIYREHVAPLFKMADVRTDITVTERKGHALSVMKECKLDEYDGVVCVGGDGSVAELCHSLVLRAQLDADSPEKPVKPVLPLGIIPAGSTDVVSCSVHGVRDPVTAALHIVLGSFGFTFAELSCPPSSHTVYVENCHKGRFPLGHQQQVDMCSFSSLGQLVCFGFSAMFGFGGRSLARAEKKRWMPSSRRREYALLKTLARLKPEDCQLSFLPVKKSTGSLSEHRDTEQDLDQDPEETWITNHGLYLNISIMSIPCLSPHAPRGLAPNTSLANGSATLTAVGNTSRSEFVKHLKRYNSSSGQFSFSFVETHNVSAVRVRPRSLVGWSEEESEEEGDSKTTPIIQSEGAAFPWNIDGELVEIANEVLIRVHPRLITLYGDDVDEADITVTCSFVSVLGGGSISSLAAALTGSQKELVAQLSLRYHEKLEHQESLRALDEEKEEISKIRSALAQDVKDTEKSQSQGKLDQSRILEEHLEATSSYSEALTKYLEKLDADRSLWNQEKIKVLESPSAAPQAVDKEKEAGKRPKKKSLFKRFRKFLCCSGKIKPSSLCEAACS